MPDKRVHNRQTVDGTQSTEVFAPNRDILASDMEVAAPDKDTLASDLDVPAAGGDLLAPDIDVLGDIDILAPLDEIRLPVDTPEQEAGSRAAIQGDLEEAPNPLSKKKSGTQKH